MKVLRVFSAPAVLFLGLTAGLSAQSVSSSLQIQSGGKHVVHAGCTKGHAAEDRNRPQSAYERR